MYNKPPTKKELIKRRRTDRSEKWKHITNDIVVQLADIPSGVTWFHQRFDVEDIRKLLGVKEGN